MSPLLPSETMDAIIDHLYDDRVALGACGLASSALLPTSRRHLFSEVVVECSGICTFLKLLDVPWSSIPTAVKRMVIRERRGQHGSAQGKTYYVPMDSARLYARLQGVKSIRFSGISLGDIPPPFWRLLHFLEGVRELEVDQMTFDTTHEFFQYICSLPALEALSISNPSWDVVPLELAEYHPKIPICIPLLDVGRLSQHGILEWILAQNPIPAIHTFRVNYDSSAAEIQTVRQYIQATGAAIQHLYVNVHTIPVLYAHNIVDLSPCTNVRSIHIEGLRVDRQAESHSGLETLLRGIISQLSSPLLHQVSLSLSIDAANAYSLLGIPDHILVESFNWGSLPRLLQEHLGDRLTKLSVGIRGYPIYQHRHTEGFLRKGPFSAFENRGVLHIDFTSPVMNP